MAACIGKRREVLWDGALVDASYTNARLEQGSIGEGREVFDFDMPWEHTCLGYLCLCRDPHGYKMYYKSHTMKEDGSWDRMYVSVIESEDGFTWRRPALSLVPFPGHPVNNILRDDIPDNFFVFYDENPACPADEKYKAVGRAVEDGLLFGLTHTSSFASTLGMAYSIISLTMAFISMVMGVIN